MIKELTCGSFWRFLYFHWCFNILLDDKQLIITVPFYRKIISVDKIEKIESAKSFMQPRYLKFLYRDNTQNTKTIRFFSVKPSMWLDEFERHGVKVEDIKGLRLRGIKSYKILKFAKILNLSAGTIAIVMVILGLIIAIFIVVKNW